MKEYNEIRKEIQDIIVDLASIVTEVKYNHSIDHSDIHIAADLLGVIFSIEELRMNILKP
jgi:hypothetical protein